MFFKLPDILSNSIKFSLKYSNTNINLSTHCVGINNNQEGVFKEHVINEFDWGEPEQDFTCFPLFFKSKNIILIPSKVEVAVKKHISRKLLKKINIDVDVAQELCLLLLSTLSDTYFLDEGRQGWKNLNSRIFQEQIDDHYKTYKKIIEVLKIGTDQGAIIECDGKYLSGAKSYSYRLTKPYYKKGITKYELKTEYVKRMLERGHRKVLAKSQTNDICKNLFIAYNTVTLPTIQEVEAEARRLVDEGYHTKKGKKLVFKNKHGKDYYKDPKKISFVEDSIELFKYLTENGLMIPVYGDEKSGGRVVDSFTLMPSWIRNLCKMNGKPMVECDYTALHPNIAMKVYGGTTNFLTHKKIADDLRIDDINKVKVEHLSFFNKKVCQMRDSIIYPYYFKNESEMIHKIEQHKYDYGHKITSKIMFGWEVAIMTEVIRRLNSMGIFVLYVYDAVMCEQGDENRVGKIMDEVILEFGVKTSAKISDLVF